MSFSYQRKLDEMLEHDLTITMLPEKSEEELDTLAERFATTKIPWDHLWKYHVYKLAVKRKQMNLPQSLEKGDFEIRNVDDIVVEFFRNQKPLYQPHLSHFIDYWIFYFVTEGRIRSDHNKKMRRFKYLRGGISWVMWSSILKNSEGKDWDLLEEDDKYKTIINITESCNNILSELRRKLQDITLKSPYARASFKNLQKHPEFVPYQNNRNHDHQKYSWKFEPRTKGGCGGSCKPADPIALPKQSVHHILRELHEWLPPMRKRRGRHGASQAK